LEKKNMSTNYPARGGQATPKAGTARIFKNEEGIGYSKFGIEKCSLSAVISNPTRQIVAE